MNSPLRWLVVATLVASIALASSASALEKSRERWDGSTFSDDWRGTSTTCSVAYYNLCSGYIWVWSGWDPGSRLGATIDACCGGGETANFLEVFMYFRTGSVPGYSFTGSMDVWAADGQGCPTGAPLASQALLPASGWNNVQWNSGAGVTVPSQFVVAYTTNAGAVLPDPMTVATDQPASDGGTCYPLARVAHAATWGTTDPRPCPGLGLFDGVGDAELLIAAIIECVVSVDESSWGDVKALYR